MLARISVAALALLLGGCAAFNSLRNEVSSYGPWPADRQPAGYVFERLPSQQAADPQRLQRVEDAARGALDAAGFRAVDDPNDAQYLMQVGVRVTSNDSWIYNDPLFWRGGFGHGRLHRGPHWGPGWGPGWGIGWAPTMSFDGEVALLIRDRKTGRLLYETRATNTGASPSIDALLPAMFEAAMKDFPETGPNPRNVTVQISQR